MGGPTGMARVLDLDALAAARRGVADLEFDKDANKHKLYGYNVGQWATVLRYFPPESGDLKGLAKSRMKWITQYAFEPTETEYPEAFGKAMAKLYDRVRIGTQALFTAPERP